MNPTLTVLLYSAIAASAAALGIVPLFGRRAMPKRWVGWANALAAGLMLGAAYALTVAGVDGAPVIGAAGAVLGIGFVYWTHALSGTEDLDLSLLRDRSPEYSYKVLLVDSLHSASEGVAIGVAMVAGLPFGVFMALAIAVHNIPEATVLSAVLSSRGARLARAAGLSVAVNLSQVLLAVFTYAVLSAAPAMTLWVLGFAVGALVYLVMVELLPESYRLAGPTSIALVVSLAMAMVVLLQGFLT